MPDIMFRVDERMIEAGALIPLDDLLESDGQDILNAWGTSLNSCAIRLTARYIGLVLPRIVPKN